MNYSNQSNIPNSSWTFSNSNDKWYTILQNGYKTNWSNLGVSSNAIMTISFWLQINNLGNNWRNIYHVSDGSEGSRTPASWIAPNDTYISICNSGSGNGWFPSPSISLNTPTYFTLVWNNLNVYVYINGALVKTNTYTDPYNMANGNSLLYIGDPWYASNGGMQIKNFCIYNTSLSANDVANIYNNQLYKYGSTKSIVNFYNQLTLKPIYIAGSGTYTMAPWNVSNFPDPTALWVWYTPNSHTSASVNVENYVNIPVSIVYVYNNLASNAVSAKVSAIVDDVALLIVNDIEIGNQFSAGWSGSYTTMNITLEPGFNSIVFNCVNQSGSAGLLATIMVGSTVLFNTNSKWYYTSNPMSSQLIITFYKNYIMTPPIPITNGLIGYYDNISYNGATWYDLSGKNNNVESSNIKGNILQNNNYLSGVTSTSIIFPKEILPSNYTLFTIAKYNGSAMGRIFQGLTTNWLSGFWNSLSGVAYHNNWITQESKSQFAANWVLSTDSKNMYRANMKDFSNTNASAGNPSYDNLSINTGPFPDEVSDWAIALIVVYNRELSMSEINTVETWIITSYNSLFPSLYNNIVTEQELAILLEQELIAKQEAEKKYAIFLEQEQKIKAQIEYEQLLTSQQEQGIRYAQEMELQQQQNLESQERANNLLSEQEKIREEIESNSEAKSLLKSLNALQLSAEQKKINLKPLVSNSKLLNLKTEEDVMNLLVGGVFKLRVNIPLMPPYIKGQQFDTNIGINPNYFYLSVETLDPNCSLSSGDKCYNTYVDNKKCTNKNLSVQAQSSQYRLVLISSQYALDPTIPFGKNTDFTIVFIAGKFYLKNIQTGYLPTLYKNTNLVPLYGDMNINKASNVTTIQSRTTNVLCGDKQTDLVGNFAYVNCGINTDSSMYLMTTNNLGNSSPIKVTVNKDGTIGIKLMTFNTFGFPDQTFSFIYCNFNVVTYSFIEKITNTTGTFLINLLCFDSDQNGSLVKTNKLNFIVELIKLPPEFMKKASIYDLDLY